MTHDHRNCVPHLPRAPHPAPTEQTRTGQEGTEQERTTDVAGHHPDPMDGYGDDRGDGRVLDLAGRWVWRGRGGHGAHLIRERSASSSTPWTLCGRRLRQPRLAWQGVCPTCRSRAHDLAVDLDAEPTPPRYRTVLPQEREG